jgi:N-methylhydantoinase A
VTDAHVVLGRIAQDQFLGGEMRILPGRSAAAVDAIARRLGMGRIAAAEGILRVANANMQRAIRVVSVERGLDPRDFALVAFGGCGGLHACEIAAELGIRTVIVPRHAGALSALGMLLAPRARDYSASALAAGPARGFAELEKQARRDLPGARLERSADLRYRGQSYELTVPWKSARQAAAAFHEAHRRVYGYANPGRPVEVVAVRVKAWRPVAKPSLRAGREPASNAEATRRRVFTGGRWEHIPVLGRGSLKAGARGPALLVDYGSTTLIPRGWRMEVSRSGSLIARR